MKAFISFSKRKSIAIFLVILSFFSSCKKDNTPPNSNSDLATISTDRVEKITQSTALVVSTISKVGKSPLAGIGVAIDKYPQPTAASEKTTPNAKVGIGTFSTEIRNLELRTTYYCRSYATTLEGTVYGEQKTFTTLGSKIPVLTTNAVEDFIYNGAKSGGNIIDEGTSSITERGIIWSKNPNPNLTECMKIEDENVGLGTYTLRLLDLEPSTKYFIRAYATNSSGIGFGNEITFTTPPIFSIGKGVTDVDGNFYPTVIINGIEWMQTNLKTSHYRDGSPIPTGLDNNAWNTTTSGAYSIQLNNPAYDEIYGKLYNFYTIVDPKGLCPFGWHISTEAEWNNLESFLGLPESELSIDGPRGIIENVGGNLKAVSKLWLSPNKGATNISGFFALPGGLRGNNGIYFNLGISASWWIHLGFVKGGTTRTLIFNNGFSYKSGSVRRNGLSVRCVRN